MTRFKILALVVLFVGAQAFSQIDTVEIEKVVKKNVLEKTDLAVIEKFVDAVVQEIVNCEDFSAAGAARSTMLAYNHATVASADIQYKPAFSAAASKALKQGFTDAAKLDGDRKSLVVLNLMIMLDSLKDPALIDTALSELNNENAAVRYWAVHALTNQPVVEQINAKSDQKAKVVSQLTALVKTEKSPEVIEQVARFGDAVSGSEIQPMLIAIADARIKQYETWTVEYFGVDGTILRVLANKIDAGQENSPFAARFGQLFSYAMQRLYKDKDLSPAQKEQLGNVLVQGEGKGLGKLGIVQTSIKRVLEKNNIPSLANEHKLLFGEGANPGKFLSVVPTSFGADANNVKLTVPRVLPTRPAAK